MTASGHSATVDAHRPEHRPAGLLSHAEPVMGTVVSFAVRPAPKAEAGARQALAGAAEVLHEADRLFSTWRPASAISRIRSGVLSLDDAPAVVRRVAARCAVLRDATGGWFDPWALPGGFDPSGLVKGWAAEEAHRALAGAGAGSTGRGPEGGPAPAGGAGPAVVASLVNAGGDIVASGAPHPGAVWRVGVRHPWQAGRLAGVVEGEGAVATSGSYERGLHLVDPFRRSPTAALASATVTGPSLAVADALATAVAAAGAEWRSAAAGLPGYEVWVIGWDGTEEATPGFRWALT